MPFTIAQLEKLKSAYATGVLKVRLGEQEVTYKSEEEMRRTIERVSRELHGAPKVQVKSIHYSKGMES